jgi:hypothetical protein
MKVLRIQFRKDVQLSEIGNFFSDLSYLYRLLTLANEEGYTKGNTMSANQAIMLAHDLLLDSVSCNSIDINIIGKGISILTKLVDLIRPLIDPVKRHTDKAKLENLELQAEQKKLKIRNTESQRFIDAILNEIKVEKEVAGLTKERLEVIDRAIDIHDKLMDRNFSQEDAKNLVQNAIGCLNNCAKFQNQTGAVKKFGLIDI